MDNFAPKTDRGLRRRGPGLSGAVLLTLSLLLPGRAGHAAEFEISADSFTVVNQVNISSVTYFSTRAIVPPDPALATQLLTPGGLYFDATYYNVWDRTALAWVKLATGTVEAGRVAKSGDFMSGQLTTASTITVQGNAFSVGASTFVVIGGNVGIGTTSPAAKLNIAGNESQSSPSFIIGSTAGNYLSFGNSTGGNMGWISANGTGVTGLILRGKNFVGVTQAIDTSAYPGSMLSVSGGASVGSGYYTNTVADGNLIVSGNVGIGTASPGHKLEVNGTFAALVSINAQTGAGYTLAASDNNKLITMDNAGAITVTIPANASVAIPVGFQATIVQKNTGTVTLSKAGGVTVISTAASLAFNAKGSAGTLVKVGTDEWLAYGDMQ